MSEVEDDDFKWTLKERIFQFLCIFHLVGGIVIPMYIASIMDNMFITPLLPSATIFSMLSWNFFWFHTSCWGDHSVMAKYWGWREIEEKCNLDNRDGGNDE